MFGFGDFVFGLACVLALLLWVVCFPLCWFGIVSLCASVSLVPPVCGFWFCSVFLLSGCCVCS